MEQKNAGTGSGFSNQNYLDSGAKILATDVSKVSKSTFIKPFSEAMFTLSNPMFSVNGALPTAINTASNSFFSPSES